MEAAVETVAITYTVYQLNVSIKKLESVRERSEAAKSILEQIKKKGYSLPELLIAKFEEIRDALEGGV